MFEQTKPHERFIQENQYKIRIGSRVPKDAVNLAYSHTNPLRPEENIQIADVSGFILENAAGNQVMSYEMWPNDNSLLSTWEGDSYIDSRSFLLTNVFLGDSPLYYRYTLTHPIANAKHDANGFYEGNSINLFDNKGNRLASSYKYRILLEELETGVYRVHVFTNFMTQPTSGIKVMYTALRDGLVYTGYSEILNPQPAYQRAATLEEVAKYPGKGFMYYQGNGQDIGQSQVYVSALPVRDISNRSQTEFRYRITVTYQQGSGDNLELHSPWFYDTVVSAASVTQADMFYKNGQKMLEGYLDNSTPVAKTASEIMKEYYNLDTLGEGYSFAEYTVESITPSVTVYTHPDGNQPVLASTKLASRTFSLPDQYRVKRKDVPITFDLGTGINGGSPTVSRHTIKASDGHVLIAGPYLGVTTVDLVLLQPFAPVNVYVKDNSVYAFTNHYDTYYVPRFMLQVGNVKQIKVDSPTERDLAESWYLRVKNGTFQRSAISSSGLFVNYQYGVPEYFAQEFDGEYGLPYRKVIDETPEIIGERKIRLRHRPLHVLHKGEGENLAITVNGIPVALKSWDVKDGIVEIDAQIRKSDTVKANYYYEEHHYTYRGYWDEKNQRFWHLDLNPSYSHTYTDINRDTGEIYESSTTRLIDKTIYLYIKPMVRYADNGTVVRGSHVTQTLFHSFEEINEPNVLLLAKIQVRPNSTFESCVLYDTRVRGGGLKPSIDSRVIEKVNPESKYNWDIGYWDGEPYSENGVMVVRVPQHLLKEHGGIFTREEVQNIINRHIAFGTLAIVEFINEPKRLLEAPKNIQIK